MRKKICFFCLILLFVFIPQNNFIFAESFSEPQLQDEILSEELNKLIPENYVLTYNSFQNFQTLDLSNKNINSLIGLEKFNFYGVKTINFSGNQLTNQSLSTILQIISNSPNLTFFILNDNNFNLKEINYSILINKKIVWGFQNLPDEKVIVNKTFSYSFFQNSTLKFSSYQNNEKIEKTNQILEFLGEDNGLTNLQIIQNENNETLFEKEIMKIEVFVKDETIERNEDISNLNVSVQGSVYGYRISHKEIDSSMCGKNFIAEYEIFIPTLNEKLSVTGNFNVVDTTEPNVFLVINETTFDNEIFLSQNNSSPLIFKVIDNKKTETNYSLLNLNCEELLNNQVNVLAYKITEIIEGVEIERTFSIDELKTQSINSKFRIEYFAIDFFGNKSKTKSTNIFIMGKEILKDNFKNSSIYYKLIEQSKKYFSETKAQLFENDFELINDINLENLNLASLEDLMNINFLNVISINLSNNNFSNSNYDEIIEFMEKNPALKIYMFFNKIKNFENKPNNLFLGIQNLNHFNINSNPSFSLNNFEDFSNEFIFSIELIDKFEPGELFSNYQTNFGYEGKYELYFQNKKTKEKISFESNYFNIKLNEERRFESGENIINKILNFPKQIDLNELEIELYQNEINFSTNQTGTFNISLIIFEKQQHLKLITIPLTIQLIDTTAPEITLENVFEICYTNSEFVLEEPKIVDNSNDEIKIIHTGNVDITKPGEYYITYFAIDKSNNISSITKTVIVQQKIDYDFSLNSKNLLLETFKSTTVEIISETLPKTFSFDIYINGIYSKTIYNKTYFSIEFDIGGTYDVYVKLNTTEKTILRKITFEVKDSPWWTISLLPICLIFVLTTASIVLIIYLVLIKRRKNVE